MAAIHHIRLAVSDLDTATRFYSPLLAALGFRSLSPRLTEQGVIDRLRFEKDGMILLIGRTTEAGRHERGKPGLHHLAFSVDSQAEVEIDMYLTGETNLYLLKYARHHELNVAVYSHNYTELPGVEMFAYRLCSSLKLEMKGHLGDAHF